MRTPREIYAAYNIMPNLQLHQLRVAAVGKLICDNFKEPVNTGDVILACLFHDMGNILKFDLGQFPELLKPKGLAYWENVKSEYAQKYGTDQHEASKQIAQELGLSRQVIGYIGSTGFSKMKEIAENPSSEIKISEYADARTAPYGIRPLDERFRDGRKRYLARNMKPATHAKGVTSHEDTFENLIQFGHVLEGQIFAHTTITPESITDTAAAPIIEELWEYPVA
jgi:hypothetical protein